MSLKIILLFGDRSRVNNNFENYLYHSSSSKVYKFKSKLRNWDSKGWRSSSDRTFSYESFVLVWTRIYTLYTHICIYFLNRIVRWSRLTQWNRRRERRRHFTERTYTPVAAHWRSISPRWVPCKVIVQRKKILILHPVPREYSLAEVVLAHHVPRRSGLLRARWTISRWNVNEKRQKKKRKKGKERKKITLFRFTVNIHEKESDWEMLPQIMETF